MNNEEKWPHRAPSSTAHSRKHAVINHSARQTIVSADSAASWNGLPPPGISVTQRVNGQKLSDPAACILHLSAPVKKETLGPKGWTGSGIPLSVRHILVSAVAALGPA